MRKLKNLLMVVLLLSTSVIFAQTKLSGKVVDETNQPLPGAAIIIKGTKTGVSTDFDGKFSIETSVSKGSLVVSFVGYETKTVNFSNGEKIGAIILKASAESLNEVVITGVIDVAKDRQTPVAVSTIKAAEISERLGTQEFPELLNATPSVYATKSGGGFGDARINIRGFDQRNTAVLINGVPVNDMENGWVYWSNWAGLSDVTSAIQIQRGLGSSKLAISSVGGTINVITKTSEQKEGGNVTTSFGNDMYQKYAASYSTGLMKNGFSASVLFSRTTGDGYIDGTKFEGYNYFIAFGQKVNAKNELMFTFTGAPQWHNQHSYASDINTYLKYGTNGNPNTKYNDAWGFLNGKEFSWRRNFYHKPVMSLNWDLTLNDKTSLSTVLYGSWGRGGGTGPIGDINNIRDYDNKLKDANGLIRFDDIYKWNSGGDVPEWGAPRTSTISDRSNGLTRRASMNSHNWYGVISNLHTNVNDKFSYDFGVDARTYKGIHYRVVSDLLGATGYVDNRDKNNPNRSITSYVDPTPSWNPFQNITSQQKIEYYNDGGVKWLGAFGQAEYKTDKLSTFIQGGISNQSFQRTDYFNLAPDVQKSSWKSLMGGNVKTGLNYNIDTHSNIFANAGYYSKQPLFSAVYPNYNNNDVNQGLKNEKIMGLEVGYGFRSQNYRFNINLYRTSWKDRYYRQSRTGLDGYIDFSGIKEVHSGIEFDGSMRFNRFTVKGMFSLGNWVYKNNVTGTEYDANNQVVGNSNTTFYLNNVKVGDAAQLTGRLAFNYNITNALSVDFAQSYFDKLYAAIDAASFTNPDNKGSLQLPSYSLMDAGLTYKIKLNDHKNSVSFRLNVNNLANTTYISESATNYHIGERNNDLTYNGINTSNRVYWGFGRTWNASVRFNF